MSGSGPQLGRGDFDERAVGQPRVRPILVGVDVVVDLLSLLIQRLLPRPPRQAVLELSEPGLDERLQRTHPSLNSHKSQKIEPEVYRWTVPIVMVVVAEGLILVGSQAVRF